MRQRRLLLSWVSLLFYVYRGDSLGDCGGCQVMSNPLILHGTQIALPKHRPHPHPNLNSNPRVPEGPAESPPCHASSAFPETHAKPEGAAKLTNPQAHATGLQAQASSPRTQVGGSQSASAGQPKFERQPAAAGSDFSTCVPLGTAASQAARPAASAALAAAGKEGADNRGRDRMLNADERLKRLKLRMQHTIQAYSGNASTAAGAGRYSRTQSLTAASPHTAYYRTNSSPMRASRVSMCAVSQRASASDETSCHSSSSCSNAANPASVQRGAMAAVSCMPSQRGIHQVVCLCNSA